MPPLTPEAIGAYIELGGKLAGLLSHIISTLRAGGATEEQIAAISTDYDFRIARREAEAQEPPVAPV